MIYGMGNWNIAGHQRQCDMVMKDFNEDNVSHAYLFIGPKRVGKYRLARNFAFLLQCENGGCMSCATCIQVDRGSHIDTIELRNEGKNISIDDINGLRAALGSSVQGKYRVILIEDIERLSLPAANALLKSLEEPGERTIFLLSTGQPHLILDTIRSRCREVPFTPVTEEEIMTYLDASNTPYDRTLVKDAFTFSYGLAGVFFHLLENPAELASRKELYNELNVLFDHPFVPHLFKCVAKCVEEERSEECIEMLEHMTRTKLFSAKNAGQKRETETLLTFAKAIELAKNDLRGNVNKKLVLENLLLRIKTLK